MFKMQTDLREKGRQVCPKVRKDLQSRKKLNGHINRFFQAERQGQLHVQSCGGMAGVQGYRKTGGAGMEGGPQRAPMLCQGRQMLSCGQRRAAGASEQGLRARMDIQVTEITDSSVENRWSPQGKRQALI